MLLSKGLYFLFGINTKGLSNIHHHIIKTAAEVLAPDGNRVNNGKLYSLVQPHQNIIPNITQLMDILNGDVANCQYWLVIGK